MEPIPRDPFNPTRNYKQSLPKEISEKDTTKNDIFEKSKTTEPTPEISETLHNELPLDRISHLQDLNRKLFKNMSIHELIESDYKTMIDITNESDTIISNWGPNTSWNAKKQISFNLLKFMVAKSSNIKSLWINISNIIYKQKMSISTQIQKFSGIIWGRSASSSEILNWVKALSPNNMYSSRLENFAISDIKFDTHSVGLRLETLTLWSELMEQWWSITNHSARVLKVDPLFYFESWLASKLCLFNNFITTPLDEFELSKTVRSFFPNNESYEEVLSYINPEFSRYEKDLIIIGFPIKSFKRYYCRVVDVVTSAPITTEGITAMLKYASFHRNSGSDWSPATNAFTSDYIYALFNSVVESIKPSSSRPTKFQSTEKDPYLVDFRKKLYEELELIQRFYKAKVMNTQHDETKIYIDPTGLDQLVIDSMTRNNFTTTSSSNTGGGYILSNTDIDNIIMDMNKPPPPNIGNLIKSLSFPKPYEPLLLANIEKIILKDIDKYDLKKAPINDGGVTALLESISNMSLTTPIDNGTTIETIAKAPITQSGTLGEIIQEVIDSYNPAPSAPAFIPLSDKYYKLGYPMLEKDIQLDYTFSFITLDDAKKIFKFLQENSGKDHSVFYDWILNEAPITGTAPFLINLSPEERVTNSTSNLETLQRVLFDGGNNFHLDLMALDNALEEMSVLNAKYPSLASIILEIKKLSPSIILERIKEFFGTVNDRSKALFKDISLFGTYLLDNTISFKEKIGRLNYQFSNLSSYWNSGASGKAAIIVVSIIVVILIISSIYLLTKIEKETTAASNSIPIPINKINNTPMSNPLMIPSNKPSPPPIPPHNPSLKRSRDEIFMNKLKKPKAENTESNKTV